MSTTLWTGPVNGQQTGDLRWPGTDVGRYLTCTGDGAPSCGQIAEANRDAQGRILPGLLRRMKVVDGDVYGAAFSAGGHVWRRVLASPADRAALRGLMLCDATYTTDRGPDKQALPIDAFVAYAREAHADGRPFVATASDWPNKDHPTGAETLWAIVDELARGGATLTDARELFPAGAQRAVRWGSVAMADYGLQYRHDEHPSRLAGEVVARVLPELGRPVVVDLPIATSSPPKPAKGKRRASLILLGLGAAGVVIQRLRRGR